jgi:hypothetical protein
MYFGMPILLILGGMLASASVIVAKRPDAKAMIAKLVPFQALIGIGLLGFGVLGGIHFREILLNPKVYGDMYNAILWAMVAGSLLLGLMFGMPMVARLSPGGAAIGEELAKKIAPFQAMIGGVAILAGLGGLLLLVGIIGPNT